MATASPPRYGNPETRRDAQHQVLCEVNRERGFARIILNRDDKRNALSVPMRDRMTDFIHQLEADDDVKVIIFESVGSSFSSGAQLDEDWGQRGKTRRFTVSHAYLYHTQMTWGRAGFGQAINRCSKVTIAQVQGYCAAASYFLLASRCDFIMVSEDARFGALEASFMGPAGATASIHLNRILGTKAARYVGYTGRPIDAHDARRYGMAHGVVPRAELSAQVQDMAARIAARPAGLLRYLKGRIRVGESLLASNVPVISGLLSSHFIRRAPDEHNFFETARKQGMKAALDAEQRHRGTSHHEVGGESNA